MENLIFSFNTIAPIFVIVAIGAYLKKSGFAKPEFFAVSDKLGFKICLPCLLFMDIMDASFADIDIRMIWLSACLVTFIFAVSGLIIPIFFKKNEDRGALIQGMCRSNAAILGVTIAANLFGESGTVVIAAVLPVVVALYNVYSVITLSIFAPRGKKLDGRTLALRIGKNILTNPLIIAVVLGLLWNVTGLTMPVVAARSLNYLADLCVPLALLSLGASFSVQELQESVGKALLASCVKTIVIPLVAVTAACLMGMRGVSVGVMLVIFGGPAAIASYTMSRQMNSNHVLAGEIVLISTLMSGFTLFFGIFILKVLQLI